MTSKNPKLQKTLISAEESREFVLSTADKAWKEIFKKVSTLHKDQQFLIMGRIVSVLHGNHYHLTLLGTDEVEKAHEQKPKL